MLRTRAVLIIAAVAVFVCPNLRAAADSQSVDLPTGASAQRVRAFVAAFNFGDDAAMSAFYKANMGSEALASRPIDDRLQMYHRMRTDMGSIQPVRFLIATGDRIDMLVKTDKGDFVAFDFRFDNSTDRMIVGLGVQFSSKDAQPPSSPQPGSKISETIKSYLDSESKADRFSGVVLLARGNDVVFQHAYGLANKTYNVSNSLDMRFNLGSINKLMTRVAIEQLVEQRKLSYDQTLGSAMPDYPNRQVAQKVTIRELVDMTSGIGDFFGPQFAAAPKNTIRDLSGYLPFFVRKPLAFEPGTRELYSNGGYVVLGLIIQKISGQSYYDYIHDRIFAPAGMKRSGWFARDVPTLDVATGYTKKTDEGGAASGWRENVYLAPARGSSAGGGQSTASDMLAFARALQRGKLLDSAGTRAIAGGAIGIAGGAPGINATLDVDPLSDYVLVVVSNYDPPSAEHVATKIRGLLGK